MRKIFYYIVCATAIFALYSCGLFEDETPSKETEGVKTIVELPDSIKQKIVEQDALMTELLNKIDTLTAELNSNRAKNAELKTRVAELESPKSTWAYVSIGAFVLGLIALALAYFRPNEDNVYDIVNNCLENSRRIKELQNKVNILLSSQRNNMTSHTSSSYVTISDSRLRQIESQLAQVIEELDKKTNPVQQTVSPRQETRSYEEHEYEKVGYAKVDTDMYFTTIYSSNQEGCVFKITFTSQTKGKFNIISLDKIQSRNDWQKKVECSGASIKEASDFRLEEDGICEKIDEINWKVTKPLKIRLLK